MRVAITEIISLLKQTNSVGLTAKTLGVARSTVYRWKKRATTYRKVLLSSTERKSTRPYALHYKLNSKSWEAISSLRKTDHLGARKIQVILKLPASYRTIHRFLKQRGFIEKQTNFRRPLFQNGKAMRPRNTKQLGYLQMDTKHVTPELSGLTCTVYEYAAIDIVSRYKFAVLLPDISDESASLALEFFLKWSPFKVVYIQTDNGLEYQYAFEKTCQKHGLNHYFIHKNSPNENAVIERSFRTDQDEFYYWLKNTPQHLGELNEWFQKYIVRYNTWRPHQALDYKTPMEMVKLYQDVAEVVSP